MTKAVAKISGIQLVLLMTTFNLALPVMEMITPTVARAKQDAWLSVGIATVASMLFTLIALLLSRMYDEETFVGCMRKVFGKWMGSVIIVAYAAQWIVVTGYAVRQITDFIMPALQLYETPPAVVMGCILLLVAYVAMMGGVESIARSSELLGPLVIITLILVIALTLNIQHLDYLRPFMQPHFWSNITTGAIPSTSFLAQTTLAMVIYPYLSDKKSYLTAVWGTGIAGFILLLCTLATVATFGPNVPTKIWSPFFMLTRYISIGDFIQNIDAVVIVIWFFSAFIRAALYTWVAAEVASDFLRTNIKGTILFVCVATFVVSLLPPTIVQSAIDYPRKVVLPIVLPVLNIGLPTLGLVVGYFRTRAARGKSRWKPATR